MIKVTCSHCQAKFKVPKEKIPQGRKVRIGCPKCGEKISIDAQYGDDPDDGPQIPDFNISEEEAPASSFDAPAAGSPSADPDEGEDGHFDFIEEEGPTALICESNAEVVESIKHVLGFLEYHITEADNTRDALKKMRYHTYDTVIVNEMFDCESPDANGVLMFMSRLTMNVRRDIFVTLISDRFRTMDYNMAFTKSVNLIVNTKNIGEFETIFQRGMAETESLYRVFKESLKKFGRI